MRLRERYCRLTLWNRIALWGSVASILGLVATFGFPIWQARMSDDKQTLPIHITQLEFYEPKEGQPAAANAHYEVSVPSVKVSGNGTLFLLTPRSGVNTDWDLAFQEVWAQAVAQWKEIGPERVVPRSKDVYVTVFGPPLSKSDVGALLAGSSALFFSGRLRYSGRGTGTIEFCVMFKHGAKILCPAHNGPIGS